MYLFPSNYFYSEADECETRKKWSPYFILALICGFVVIIYYINK